MSEEDDLVKLDKIENETKLTESNSDQEIKAGACAADKRSQFIKQSDVQDIIRMMNNEMSLDVNELNDKENDSQKSVSNDTGYDEVNVKTTSNGSLVNNNNNNSANDVKSNQENESSDYYSQTEKDSSSDSCKNEPFLNNDDVIKSNNLIHKMTNVNCVDESEENFDSNKDTEKSDRYTLDLEQVNDEDDERGYGEVARDEDEDDDDDDGDEEEEKIEDYTELDIEMDDFIQKAIEFGANALDISKRGLTRVPKKLFQLVDLQVCSFSDLF
jgi:hypothetical protein